MAILDAVFADRPGQTPQEVERRRRIAKELLAQAGGAEPIRSPWQGVAKIAQALVGGYEEAAADKQDASNRTAANKALIDAVYGGSSAPSFASQARDTFSTNDPGAGATVSGPSKPINMDGNQIYDKFMGTVKAGGVSNPYALAAIAATGKAESGFLPQNANRSWSDPSQSGQAGTAGGIMSWRADRLNNLHNFARAKGEQAGAISPETQAAFFLQENPALIQRLNSAKSTEEAQRIMNEAWKFAGWDQPGGEAGRRIAAASSFLPTFQGKPQQVASLDPSIGMTSTTPAEKPAENPRMDFTADDQRILDEYYAREHGISASGDIMSPDKALASYQQSPSFPGKQADDMDVAALPQPRNVGALPVPPNAQPLPQGIPAEFAGSQQLANAQGGIVPALMGGTAASPEQIAQARAIGAAQPQPQPQGQDNRALIATLLGNPYTAEAGQQLLMQEMQRRQESSDPLKAMQVEEQRLKLNALKNPPPDFDYINGKDGSVFRADKRTGEIKQVYGGKPDTFRTLTDAEEQQMGLDTSKAYQIGADNKVAQIGGGGTTVNIDQKAEGAFDKKLAEKQAETFDTMATEGLNARADIGIINELDTLLQGQGGTLSGIAGIAAKYGVGGEGIGDLQAVQALINKLVPTQRAPGSGSMSDRDVELFTRSLPSLWNEPGGNAKILRVMRGLAEYKQAQGEIADQVLTGDMSRQEARRALRSLPNPLAQEEPKNEAGSPPAGVDAEDWKYMTPEERKLFQ